MLRTLAASPWSPLLYWTVAVIAMRFDTRQEFLKRRLGPREFEMPASVSTPSSSAIYAHTSGTQSPPANEIALAVSKSINFWYPQISVLRRFGRFIPSLATEVVTNSIPVSAKALTTFGPPVTTLSIQVESSEQTIAKSLLVQCRTSLLVSNAHGKAVTIHGVVTQEVVSSAGRILIMAGSRVVGTGILDSENGRFKSDGLWSIFLDETELRVQAQLLDRPEGLPGLLGQASMEAWPRGPKAPNGRYICVPRNAPFLLEIHGGILFRDPQSNQGDG